MPLGTGLPRGGFYENSTRTHCSRFMVAGPALAHGRDGRAIYDHVAQDKPKPTWGASPAGLARQMASI